jgi:hypothetical protein
MARGLPSYSLTLAPERTNIFLSGGGALDITAPTSGDWSEVAIYQGPSLTKNVDISAAGNTPTWNIAVSFTFRIPA